MAALGGTVAGVLLSTQVAGPLIAQEADKSASVYEQLDLFGDICQVEVDREGSGQASGPRESGLHDPRGRRVDGRP